jgi:hypothetical protein
MLTFELNIRLACMGCPSKAACQLLEVFVRRFEF